MDDIAPSLWRRLDGVLDELLSLPPERCAERLDALCGDDEELHGLAQQLLSAARQSGLLDAPISLSPGQGRMLLAQLLASSASPQLLSSFSALPGTEQARFVPGSVVAGRYRVVGLVGRGGMGEVYRAEDLRLGQPVALKFLPREFERDPERANLLLAEVSLARRIAHPNVCRVYDVVETNDNIFLTMEYVDGEDLRSLLLRVARMPPERAAVLARQLASGLAAAHEMGIVHRDLKPANLMMDGRGRIRITDFGLAAAVDKIGREDIRAGTPWYMAPEQRAGREVTERSDVYSLGLVFYELFTGRYAFDGSRGMVPAEPRLPRDPSEIVEGLDHAIAEVILRCLEPDPANRPSSAIEVLRALPGGDALAAALAAGETPSPEVVAAAGPRGKISARTAGLLLTGFAVMLGVVLLLADETLLVNRVATPKPVAALAADARGIAERLGYDVEGWDSHSWSSRLDAEWMWCEQNLKGPHRWDLLADPDASIYAATHHFSPQLIVPTSGARGGGPTRLNATGRPEFSDLGWGSLEVTTDFQGRLRSLEVKPWPAVRANGQPIQPDWNEVFDLAALDRTAFHSVEPSAQPPTFADTRAAWVGTWPDGSCLPVRLEAAALEGRFVFFDLVFPFDPTWKADAVSGFGDSTDTLREAAAPSLFSPLSGFGLIPSAFFGSIVAIGGWLFVRNLSAGLGDRRGALRFSMAVLGLSFGVWIFGAHHVQSVSGEILAGVAWLTGSIPLVALAWALYIVFEPEIRRMRPDALVAWTRLIAGRWRDPLVGRDLLIGLAVGPWIVLVGSQLHVILPRLLGSTSPPAPFMFPFSGVRNLFYSAPLTPVLLDGGSNIAAVFAILLYAVETFAVFTVFFFILLRILRVWWAAVVAMMLIGAAGAFDIGYVHLSYTAAMTNFSALGIALGCVWSLILYGLLGRFGPLAFFASLAFLMTYHNVPFTLDPTRPYFAAGLAFAVGLMTIGTLAAVIACGLLERRGARQRV